MTWAITLPFNERRFMGRYFADVAPPGPYLLFDTREQARAFIRRRFGYLKTRKDLRTGPHWWRMPRPVRVDVILRKAS